MRADGAVSLEAMSGSIHRIGALAQGLEACNGWTFWHLETPKGLTVIDELRAKVRAEMVCYLSRESSEQFEPCERDILRQPSAPCFKCGL